MSEEPAPRRWPRLLAFTLLTFVLGAIAGLFAIELKQGRLQARFLTNMTEDIGYWVEAGPSPHIRFPQHGPYDTRLGYTKLPDFTERLIRAGGHVEAQARWSDRMQNLSSSGILPLFVEKTRTGLTIVDRIGRTLYDASTANLTYSTYEDIPPAVARTLMFIENRELMDTDQPHLNPAVEWKRLALAVSRATKRVFSPGTKVPGGSTLATQLEKFRHSRNGRTHGSKDKIHQMASASMRAYLEGPDTTQARQRILVDYLNSVPLGAVRGVGEIHGFGNGLHAWFGAHFDRVNARLIGAETVARHDPVLAGRAVAYNQTLALLIGLRRPSYFLRGDRAALKRTINRYARLLAKEKVISPALRDATIQTELVFRDSSRPMQATNLDRKGSNAVRLHLLRDLGLERLYDLDRLDLKVHTTLDAAAQIEITRALHNLADLDTVKNAGLIGRARLTEDSNLSEIQYSFTLYERVNGANVIRVHTDTHPGPFSLNDGMKLELGSTAKLRTVITYLALIAEIWEQYLKLDPETLKTLKPDRADKLGQWVRTFLLENPGASLTATLDASLERRYSANATEAFFTSGGMITFHNFDHAGARPSVRASFAHSVNLPFVRIMRDIIHHIVYADGEVREILNNHDHPRRREFLERYASADGAKFIKRFYKRHHKKTSQESLKNLAKRIHGDKKKLAVMFRTIRPQAGVAELTDLLNNWTNTDHDLVTTLPLWEDYAPSRFDLGDRGYICGIHPLELWTVRWLHDHPDGTLSQMSKQATTLVRESYSWLLKGKRWATQNRRMRSIIESDAYIELHRRWARLGYPFPRLVPSFGTALGSSGDRPSALAELAGIISSGGIRYPTYRITRYHFGQGTPYETVISPGLTTPERVLPIEVATAAHELMRNVVTEGTAHAVMGAFGGGHLKVAGKTGTGDNRRRKFDRKGKVFAETVKDRTASLVFTVGERWFGVVVAYVPGQAAADHQFTSSLPTHILRNMAPRLLPAFAPTRQQHASSDSHTIGG